MVEYRKIDLVPVVGFDTFMRRNGNRTDYNEKDLWICMAFEGYHMLTASIITIPAFFGGFYAIDGISKLM